MRVVGEAGAHIAVEHLAGREPDPLDLVAPRCRTPCSTSSSAVAPGSKLGLSCTQGSGHSSPSSIACWTVAAMRLSAMSTKLRVKPA
jgi:hypothetical protein